MSSIGGIGGGLYIAPPRPVRRTKPVAQQDRQREEKPSQQRKKQRDR